jgi:hypothetical protein
MFTASLLVCAATANFVDFNSCVALNDMRGPYTTEDQCYSRVDELTQEIEDSELTQIMIDMFLLNYGLRADSLYVEGHCVPTNEVEA